MKFNTVQDSGKRQEFDTGSVRDTCEGKGRFDLITPIGLRRLAIHYENGAKKYGDRNWQKGQPVSRCLDSAIRHLYAYLGGSRNEDHLAAVAWNAMAAMHFVEECEAGRLPAELDDVETQVRTFDFESEDPLPCVDGLLGPQAKTVRRGPPGDCGER